MIRGVVFTHVGLGRAFVESVASFLGSPEGLIGLSNEGLTAEQMLASLRDACGENEDGVIVFTSVFGGSCWQTAERLRSERPRYRHITGVNMPMLLAFINKREQMDLDLLVESLPQYGRKGIRP